MSPTEKRMSKLEQEMEVLRKQNKDLREKIRRIKSSSGPKPEEKDENQLELPLRFGDHLYE